MTSSFATLLNCMDGRVQVPTILYLLDRFEVEYLDTITTAGIVRYLSEDTDAPQTHAALDSIGISLKHHHSNQIAISAHEGCLGNPRPRERQHTQLVLAVAFLKNLYPECEVIGLWVDEVGVVHEISASA